MKTVRLIFYVMSILVVGEVTELFSLYRQDAAVCFSSEMEENPLEEDETKEIEEDDDYLVDSHILHLYAIRSLSASTPALFFQMTEPITEIPVPPPQG